MIDLTKITTPFGLLDEETKEALKSHKGEIEIYTSGGWCVCVRPPWDCACTYRAKPGPREFWIRAGGAFSSREAAQADKDRFKSIPGDIIHVREVVWW